MQVLAPSCAAFALIFPLYALLTTLGHPKLAAYITMTQVALLVAVLAPVAAQYDLVDVARARLAVMAVLLVAVMAVFARLARLSPGAIVACLWRPALGALVMIVAVEAVEVAAAGWPALPRLLAAIAAGAATFAGTVLLAWRLAGAPDTIERDLLGMAGRRMLRR